MQVLKEKRVLSTKQILKRVSAYAGLSTLAVMLAAVILSGCNQSPESINSSKYFRAPIVDRQVTYQNCVIKYINFEQFDHKIYVAQCKDETTISETHEYRSGKTYSKSVSISRQIEDLKVLKQKEDLRESALKKLSEEERKALLEQK